MAIITTNGSFGATAAVTSTTLNAVADAATFVSGAVDGTSLELISGGSDNGKLGIKDAGVTKAKIENISAPLRVLGRTTSGAGVAEEVTINDNDDLSGASAITLATDESIKAYVDEGGGFTPSTYAGGESVTLPNGLIMKFGKLTNVQFNETFYPVDYADHFGTAVISVQATIHSSVTISGTRATVIKDSGVTGFEVAVDHDTNTSSGDIDWFAIGY